MALASARIDSSLYQAGQDAAVPLDIMSDVIKAFSYDVDFEREIHPGDSFEIVYERIEDDQGRLARTGNIRYAALVQGGRPRRSIGSSRKRRSGDFYNAKGESVRKDLLRTPLDVVRVTSGFGMRKHPILGYSKMHKGVDFAASTGTPILRVRRRHGGVRRQVQGLRQLHQDPPQRQYETAYGHMSRFAKGLSRRRQGQAGSGDRLCRQHRPRHRPASAL